MSQLTTAETFGPGIVAWSEWCAILQIEISVMSLKMADGSPPAEVQILTDSDILQKEISVITVTSESWMERFVINPHVLCLDGLTSDYDPEDKCSDVDGEEGVFQDMVPKVVSV